MEYDADPFADEDDVTKNTPATLKQLSVKFGAVLKMATTSSSSTAGAAGSVAAGFAVSSAQSTHSDNSNNNSQSFSTPADTQSFTARLQQERVLAPVQ